MGTEQRYVEKDWAPAPCEVEVEVEVGEVIRDEDKDAVSGRGGMRSESGEGRETEAVRTRRGRPQVSNGEKS